MRRILCAMISCFAFFSANTQVGIGTATPNSSAILDLTSTNRGFLPPRMTQTQINAIVSPAAGLIVFDTDIKSLKMFDGSRWLILGPREEGVMDPPGEFTNVLDNTSATAIFNDIQIGPDNSLYFIGFYSGTLVLNGISVTASGSNDIVFGKYNDAGILQWMKSVGSTGIDNGYTLSIDAAGNIYIGGQFQLTVDFNPGAGVANLISSGNSDGFYAKYDNNGNWLWSKRVGGSSIDNVSDLITDGTFIYIGGVFSGTATFNPTSMTSAGGIDAFIGKYSVTDGNLGVGCWINKIGGMNTEEFLGMSLHASSIVVGGSFQGTCTFPGGGTLTSASLSNGFVALMSTTGIATPLQLTSNGDVLISGIKTDPSDNIYVAGQFQGSLDANPGAAVNSMTSAGVYDIFVIQLNASGTYLNSRSYGGIGQETVTDMDIDISGAVYVFGRFNNQTNFGLVNLQGYRYTPFILKTYFGFDPTWVKLSDSIADDWTYCIDVNEGGNLIYTFTQMGTSPFMGFNKTKHFFFGMYLAKYVE